MPMPEERAATPAGAAGATAAPPQTGGPAGDPTGRAGRPARTSSWWFVAPAFVVGMFAGAVTLGLLREDPPPVPAPESSAGADASGGSASDGGSASPGASAEFTVNEACLRVVNGTQDLVDVIGDVGDAAADLDIAGLNQAIRRLQPLERSLRDDLDGCETDTTLPGDVTPAPRDADPSESFDPESSEPESSEPESSEPGSPGSRSPESSESTTAPAD